MAWSLFLAGDTVVIDGITGVCFVPLPRASTSSLAMLRGERGRVV